MTVNLHDILVSAIQNINNKEGNSNLSYIMLFFLELKLSSVDIQAKAALLDIPLV